MVHYYECVMWRVRDDDYADGDDTMGAMMVVVAKKRAKLGKEMEGGKNRGCTSAFLVTYSY